jgi:hypothetical protein
MATRTINGVTLALMRGNIVAVWCHAELPRMFCGRVDFPQFIPHNAGVQDAFCHPPFQVEGVRIDFARLGLTWVLWRQEVRRVDDLPNGLRSHPVRWAISLIETPLRYISLIINRSSSANIGSLLQAS